jgi:YVTN family beta-propeller protein
MNGKWFKTAAVFSVVLVSVVFAPVTAAATAIPVGPRPFGVGVNPTTNKIYVGNQGSNTVSVIDGATDTVIGSPIEVGAAPFGVGVNPTTNKIYVGNQSSNTVSVIDGATDTVIGSPIEVGAFPFGIGVNPTTNKIYVGNQGSNTVSVIDGATDTVIGSPIAVWASPFGVGVNPVTNKIYVTNYEDNTVLVIDGATDTVIDSPIAVGPFPLGIGVNPATNKIYVANGFSNTVSVIDGATDTVIGSPIAVGAFPFGIGVNPTTNKIYVGNQGSNTVSVIDGATDTVKGSPVTVSPRPFGVGVNPATCKVYVVNNESNTVSVIYAVVVGSVSPSSGPDKDPAFKVEITGDYFQNAPASIRLTGPATINGSSITYTDEKHVGCTFDLDGKPTGSYSIEVTNPDKGVGTKSDAFTINTTPGNPVPTVSGLDPDNAIAGGAGFALKVMGSGFIANSVVMWNGKGKATTLVGDHLEADVSDTDIASAGTASVTVCNPGPGGGTSDGVSFTVHKRTCTITYTGDTFKNTGQSIDLSATIQDTGTTSYGDIRNAAPVCFEIYSPTGLEKEVKVDNVTETSSGNGVAAATVSLTPNIYSVRVKLDSNNGCYEAPETSDTELVVYDPKCGSLAGLGFMANGGLKFFGFQIRYPSGRSTDPKGCLLFTDMSSARKPVMIHAHDFRYLVVPQGSNRAYVAGSCTYNGTKGYTFIMDVQDNSRGFYTKDMLHIVVNGPQGIVYEIQGRIVGNIVIGR